MKIKSNIHAGYATYEECKKDVDYWKMEAQAMDAYANSGKWPSDVPYPIYTTTPPPTTLPYPPTYPTYPTSGGGYVNGVYYPDYSGYCG